MPQNPYHQDGQPPTLRRSVFVFMDILGYSDKIRLSDDVDNANAELQALHCALAAGRDRLVDGPDPLASSERDSYALKAFTDNIVIGWPVMNDAESEFGTAFSKLAAFQLQMAISGYFVRGGLSVGDAYVDEIAVFGAALSEAYRGEATLARDPRIVLTDSAVKATKHHLTYYAEQRYAPHVKHVFRDADGQWFLNYLEAVLFNEEAPLFTELRQHKMQVETSLTQHRANPPVWAKYAWVAGYHNYFRQLNPGHFDKTYDIDLALFQGKPSLIVT